MKKALKFSIFSAMLACGAAQAQTQSSAAATPSGMDRMQAIIDSVAHKNDSPLPADTRQAINSGIQSATVSADIGHMDAKTVDFSVQQAQKWEQMAREAYVAALPPRDRALGRSVLLGDGTGGPGRMYIFVSRSMPDSMLRAYAVDAFYLGAQLLVKGVRKGDTLKEFVANAMEDFNSVDGMAMAGLDINPNLFDMFDVKVVPAVVWTNRVGLDDVGSGCQNLPDGAPVEKLYLEGPEEQQLISVDKPVCAKLPDTAFYKMSGALSMTYVLDRFQDAGLPKDVTDGYRAKLAERTGNIFDGSVKQSTGHGMAPVSFDAKLDRLPKAVLLSIKEQLETGNVQRGPYGPTFSPDADDDTQYRQELTEKIRHGLGL